MASKLLKLVLPVGSFATGAYFYNNDVNPLRTAYSYVTSTEKKTFDEMFPRGEWNENWDL